MFLFETPPDSIVRVVKYWLVVCSVRAQLWASQTDYFKARDIEVDGKYIPIATASKVRLRWGNTTLSYESRQGNNLNILKLSRTHLWAAHRYPYVAQAYQSDAPEHVLMLCSLGTGRAYRIDHL